MRNTQAIFAFCLLISAATAAFADTPQPPPARNAAAAAPAPEKRICRMMTHQGMLVRTNVCKTQKEWDEQRHRQQHDLADFQNRNYQTSSGH